MPSRASSPVGGGTTPAGAAPRAGPGAPGASLAELQASFLRDRARISALLDAHEGALAALCGGEEHPPGPLPPPEAAARTPRASVPIPPVGVQGRHGNEPALGAQLPRPPKSAPIVAWPLESGDAGPRLREGAARCTALRTSAQSAAPEAREEEAVRPSGVASHRGSAEPVTPPTPSGTRKNRASRPSKFLTHALKKSQTKAFVDAKILEERAERDAWLGEYDVAELYHSEGVAQWLAQHPVFIAAQVIAVFLNVVWIGIETDYNDKEVLYEADVGFQLVENLFCIFFLWEWFVRLCAFRRKVQSIGDFWFVFDTVLLATMVLETWILFIVSAVSRGASGTLPTDLLRLVRLARLTRSLRIGRFLRNIPELAVIMKGIMVVMRTVFLILILLTSLLYVFGILFVQVARDSELKDGLDGSYNSVPSAMLTLILGGLIPDMAPTTYALAKENPLFAAMFMFFVFLGFVTIMNMLIGVLVQVVGVVATVEAESNQLSEVKNVLLDNPLDLKEGDRISVEDIIFLLSDKELISGLREVGIDTDDLLNHSRIVFQGRPDITMYDFWQLAVQHQGGNVAKVKDLLKLRQFIYSELSDLGSQVARLSALK